MVHTTTNFRPTSIPAQRSITASIMTAAPCRVWAEGLLCHVAMRTDAQFRVRPPSAESGLLPGRGNPCPLRATTLLTTAIPVSTLIAPFFIIQGGRPAGHEWFACEH